MAPLAPRWTAWLGLVLAILLIVGGLSFVLSSSTYPRSNWRFLFC
jgi:hypothetical protein